MRKSYMSPFGLFPHTAKNMDAPIQPPKRPYYDKKRLGIRVYQGEQRLRTILRPHTLAYMRSSVELTQPEVSRVELFPRPEAFCMRSMVAHRKVLRETSWCG